MEKTKSQASKDVQNHGAAEGSKDELTLWSRYCWYFAASLAIIAVIGSGTELQALNRFGETFTNKLCDILPPPPPAYNDTTESQTDVLEDEDFNDAVVTVGEAKVVHNQYSTYNPKVTTAQKYDALRAMEARFFKMKEMCNRYSDVMRPESLAIEWVPKSPENFLYYAVKKFTVCQMKGVASKGVDTFVYAGEMAAPPASMSQKAFREQFPRTMKHVEKRAMVVRHPFERLVSIYRNNYEASFNAKINKKIEAKFTFPEFLELIVYGYSELSHFFEENNLDMNTPTGAGSQIDTGMVDGYKGDSQMWNSYWRSCGVCNPDFQPHYILHMETLKQDFRVILDKWMETKYWNKGQIERMEKYLASKWDIKSSNPLLLEHYYSQVKKSEIQALYEKYQMDFEIFGYTHDYFLAMGKEG